MKSEQEIIDQCNELFERRNNLPRFNKTKEEQELSDNLLLQATALQWALGISTAWWGR